MDKGSKLLLSQTTEEHCAFKTLLEFKDVDSLLITHANVLTQIRTRSKYDIFNGHETFLWSTDIRVKVKICQTSGWLNGRQCFLRRVYFWKVSSLKRVQFCSRFDATRWHISVVVTKPRYFDNLFFLIKSIF